MTSCNTLTFLVAEINNSHPKGKEERFISAQNLQSVLGHSWLAPRQGGTAEEKQSIAGLAAVCLPSFFPLYIHPGYQPRGAAHMQGEASHRPHPELSKTL